jgi:alpha-L-fucosidase
MSCLFQSHQSRLRFKNLRLFLVILILFTAFQGAFSQQSEMNYPLKKEIKWFTDSRFGMFIHWTPVGAIDQEIGWTWGNDVPAEKYMQLCREFNPVKFDAEAWVQIAKNTGMKYIVFVPKHHDGFSLWDTKATDFNIMNTPYGKDICKQLSEACEKNGILFCTYYSIADLHENGWPHMYGVEADNIPSVKGGMDAYFEFVKTQCAELIQKYHTKNFWFDGFWHPEWYGNPKYRTQLYQYLKSLDANIIMSRLQMPYKPEGGQWDDGWDFDKNVGDYHSREDHGGKEWEGLYYNGPWEFCSSVAYPNYSYNSKLKLKTPKECIQTMVKIAGRNGNYLLDMAPSPDGSVEEAQVKLFGQIGDWMKIYGQSIYQTEGGPFLPIKGEFVSTRKENKIYLHLLNNQNYIILPSLNKKIISAKIFQTDRDVKIEKTKNKIIFYVPYHCTNENDVIIELVIKGNTSDLKLLNAVVN